MKTSAIVSRRTAVQAALVTLLVAPTAWPAHAATIQGVVTSLDENEPHNLAGGAHSINVIVGAPNSDSWCSVEVTVQDEGAEYIWLKDTSTSLTRRVYGAAKFTKPTEPTVLRQQLKVGYRAKPFFFSRESGLYEGEAFTVRCPKTLQQE